MSKNTTNKYKKLGEEILSLADIKINGDRPWDIQVYNEDFYQRVFSQGALGAGESYMDGWWDVKELDQFFTRILSGDLDSKISARKALFLVLKSKLLNRQKKSKSFEVGEQHYDAGNDLYKLMLDKRMVYTCGYWKNAKNLDEAQEAKLELTCQKLKLQKGMRVLDIGCGWGSFAKYAAEKYGVNVVGVTVSKEQVELGNKLCKGLPVEIRLQDYRDVNEKFDRIVSLGMFEHVGYKNYRKFMQIAHRCLKDDGLFLLHTIGNNVSKFSANPWIDKYIFPNGMLPSIQQLGKSTEKLFVMEDWHNFGPDYDKTLMAWFNNFNNNWDKLKDKYNGRFYKMWKFYLLVFAAAFRVRDHQLWQIVLSKKGIPGGYESIR